MTRLEKTELTLIVASGGLVWLASPALPGTATVGRLVLFASALLLLQSLLRDLWLLRRARAAPLRPAAQCMCIESTLGSVGIVAGAMLALGGVGGSVELGRTGYTLGIMGVLFAGWLIKDLVVQWNPWRIVRDKNHMNIVVSLRAPR